MNFKKDKKAKSYLTVLSTAALFGLTVFYWNNQNYGLAVECNGKPIATVSDESVYEEANHMILDQLSTSNKNKVENATPELKVTPIDKTDCCESPNEIKNKIIETSQEIISEGYGVYSDNKLITVGKNEQEINSILKNLLDNEKSKNPEMNVEFKEKIEIKKGLFSPEEIKSIEDIEKVLTVGSEKFTIYTVGEEDTIVGIAEKFNISPEELMSLNKISEDSVKVGDKLTIKNTEKLINIKIFNVVFEERDITLPVEKIEDPEKDTSYEEVLEEGKIGKEFIKYEVEYKNNEEINKKEIEHTVTEEAVAKKIKVGTKKISESKNFIWPVPYTTNITSPFGWRQFGKRKSEMHQGIDISKHGIDGKNIVASKSGTIQVAKYGNNGYGNHIMIKHDDGTQTVYGHCKSLSVKVGQRVCQGDTIAAVGSTGDSTGPHLHFEIRVGGKAQNPKLYV